MKQRKLYLYQWFDLSNLLNDCSLYSFIHILLYYIITILILYLLTCVNASVCYDYVKYSICFHSVFEQPDEAIAELTAQYNTTINNDYDIIALKVSCEIV